MQNCGKHCFYWTCHIFTSLTQHALNQVEPHKLFSLCFLLFFSYSLVLLVALLSHFADWLLFLQVTMFLCCATILAIIQYCNFCQLSFWMRSVLATATGVALLLLLYSPLNRYRWALVICTHTSIPNEKIQNTHVRQQIDIKEGPVSTCQDFNVYI